MDETTPAFRTRTGLTIPALPAEVLREVRSALQGNFGLHTAQLAEAASYSFAMVVRYALGLSAEGGQVCAVAQDGLSGSIALATLRHIVNAGGSGFAIITTPPEGELSVDLQLQLAPLEALGVPFESIAGIDPAQFGDLISQCHNVLWGGSSLVQSGSPLAPEYIVALNEARTPVHAVELPAGIDPDSGAPETAALYASSTLALGAPLTGLWHGREYAGRIYVCDQSIPLLLYRQAAPDGETPWEKLFAEQPVVQVFPITGDEDQNPPAGGAEDGGSTTP